MIMNNKYHNESGDLSGNVNINDAELAEDGLPETAVLEDEVVRTLNPDGEDILWFSLKKGDIPFKIGLSDILTCLRFAEEQGEVPELPRMWWIRVSSMYSKISLFSK